MSNRRSNVRFYFTDNPLDATVHVHKIKQTEVKSKAGPIQILDISGNGLQFFSPLRFQVTDEVLLCFNFRVTQKWFNVYGRIKRQWQSETEQGYIYGVALEFEEYAAKTSLIQTVHQLRLEQE
ncbi:PilZ domain-containing protein [Sinobaca qinghaiensis]|uniref:PilZ domain-containing protein n=1 Tax=Sinobaca qinghaiensis TaxID=342944 RepID=A0A419UU60_9BACL|nr:PilZ domain-containing protein [Sinobaca qinghaiensis]RKD68144.1 PilZ domain-containing protein [Sinobaca qinghaiensis]